MASTAAMAPPKIMRRPAAASACEPAGAADGTLRGANALLDDDKKSPGAAAEPSPALILDKEEKKDDAGNVTAKPEGQAGAEVEGSTEAPPGETEEAADDWLTSVDAPAPAASSEAAAAAAAASSKSAWNPLEEVDSALLSALCDQRERKALFRLEQVMLDFMKDRNCGYMEVGGAYNAIVVSQNDVADFGDGGVDGQMPMSRQGQQELMNQQQRGLRQTSFQRLILHRLADRFNIIREQINYYPNNNGLVDVGGNMSMGGQQNYSRGLIRLIKTEESCTPSNLLIDIDLSILLNYKNPRARTYGQGSNVMMAANGSGNYDDGTRNITENMASATLDTQSGVGGTGLSSSGKKSKKKMVIMKRNSSTGSGIADGSKGKGKGKSRRKKLEDREKAYEEARARIFGVSESSGNENQEDSGGDENGADRGESSSSVPQSVPQSQDSQQDIAPTPLNSSSCHSSFSVENNDATSPTSSAAAAAAAASEAGGQHIVPSQVISSANPTDQSSPISPESPRDQEPAASPPEAAAETGNSRLSSSSAEFVPKAASAGGPVSKAVYRNRQQEENDPDFKRRSDVRPTYVPYVASPYGPTPVGANPYAAMAQQQPSPQMIAAMQMQQQAHMQQQQQQAHFHFQRQQFPTPQDAASYGNNPPPQWTGPPRGFYPAPQQHQQQHQQPPQQTQQQQVQERQHPQAAWPQPRLNPSQQMQPPGNSAAPAPSNGGGNYGAHASAPPPQTMASSPQPQPKQPAKVLWGPGARRDSSSDAAGAARRSQTSSEGAPPATKGEERLKPEDFPALG